jgi:hypothetical protein
MLNPLPARVVARFENLRKTDRHTVYHGTDLRHLPELVNGFDATKMKGRTYNTRPHKGMFVSPELAIAKKFGQVVLELEIPARFLHGRDWAGKPLHPKTQEQAEEMYPDSFRPNLSWMLETGEPQALLLGLVSPRQIRRVFYDGKWYSRKDFLALDWDGLETSRRRPMRDLGVDVSDPSLSWEDFIEATAVLIKAPAARIQKGFDRWIEQGRSPGWVEENLSMWEPLTARRYAERFFGGTQSAARRVASRYMEAAILPPPPAMTAAARYYFIARWGAGVLAEVKKKTRSQKVRLRKIQKMLQEQKASIAGAEKALKAAKSFDLLVYHAPKNGDFANVRKRKLRYTPREVTTTDWRGDPHTEIQWEVDKPFEVHYLEFEDHPPYLESLKEYDEVGSTYLGHVIEAVERTLQGLTDFEQSIKQEIAKRKSHANLLSAPNQDLTECEMDLSGWTLWERRIPDPGEREIRETALNAKKTLKMKFDPQDTGKDQGFGGFSAYWSNDKWMVVFAGLSGYWSVEALLGRQGEVNTHQFKKSLVELDRVVAHEMRHYTQYLLKDLLDLPEIAGHPGLTDPEIADAGGTPTGESWSKWDAEEQRWVDQRIPHELRDVEFESRLGDAIDSFEQGLKRVEGTLDRDVSKENRDPYYEAETLKDYFDVFTGRSQKRLDVWGADPSAWFASLRKNDSKRYQAAVAKFTAEMDRRGFMKRLKTKTRLPVVEPDHKAWGKSISRMMPWKEGYEEEKKALQDYARFIDDLSIDQLRRHRTLVRDTGDKEYWVTPRWQDHLKEPLSKEEMEARRTEGARVEHPSYRRASASRVAAQWTPC